MKMTFRWFGESDTVPLRKIRQIPNMSGIVCAVYDTPPGQIWSYESINNIKNQAKENNLDFEVVESVPVHEDIKIGKPTRDAYISNYCENIRRLAQCGVKVICYNFMPVFDWLRSDLEKPQSDGAYTLSYDHSTVLSMNPQNDGLSLPGWDSSYSKQELRGILNEYKALGIESEKLWENFAYFINKIIPICEQTGVNMAIHPDDPPWNIFNLPRIITGQDSYLRMKQINPSTKNGITLCTGSLAAIPENDLVSIINKYADRIHFVHARNIKITSDMCFEECAHMSNHGCVDMYEVLNALYNNGFCGYIRPDHGRQIWDESAKPGYGLYDRALGSAYLNGLWEGICKTATKKSKKSKEL